MEISVGEYIRKRLRFKSISNAQAGRTIGLSESAFEKVLLRDDISVDRLIKLSSLLEEDLFAYYYATEPMLSFKKLETNALHKELREKEEKLMLQEELLNTQRKYILKLEESASANNSE